MSGQTDRHPHEVTIRVA